MFRTITGAALAFWPATAGAQVALDRVDPARVEQRAAPDTRPVKDADAPVSAYAPRTAATAGAPVTVGAITITGLRALRPADFADIIERNVGRTLGSAELAALADAVAERARERGYVFASATVAPQALVAGVLRLNVDEGGVDEVRLSGAENAAVRAALAPLVGTGPVKIDQLERRLLIAGDIDGVWLRRTRFLREAGRNVLDVQVGADPVTGLVGLANDGSRPIGPVQADGLLKASQLLGPADLLTVSAVVTPFEPDEFAYGRVRYASRVGADGTELFGAFSYAVTHPGAYVEDRNIDGRSSTASLGVFRPMWRRRDASLWLEGTLNLRTIRQDRDEVLARRDRLTVARVRATGFVAMLGGRLRADATLSRGLDLFDATQRGDPLASRRDADATFTSAALWAGWTGPLAPRVEFEVAAASQTASQPLLVSEEVGLGGGRFLRGYDYSERSGDQGAMASAELRYDLSRKLGPLAEPRLYSFVDGGRVTNLDGGFGTGTLFSVGGGARARIADTLAADLGVAVPLSGERYDSGNAAPVVNFRLSKRF
ncbi:ShlB/FhaC/HecB family hemolysin secretion/activation protein [Sphingomonas lenta]|uniref:ShlB/FhaC/HecB family hemolysin secretion/activation protein n=1 Tax=Sphingomonas lenta TaxID=1141887 RepID=UPI0015954D66|nr:ShlB/FhaC/HecB family hemolysin secretion/activation protein [Sphingomonas lenta]